MEASKPKPSLPSALTFPSYALPKALAIVSNGAPVAAEISKARFNNFWDSRTSFVDRVSLANAGRN